MPELIKLEEPTLLFGHNQGMEDPRDGLALFGTLDVGQVYGIRAGVIGTKEGIRRYKDWVQKIQQPLYETETIEHRPIYPGFETTFKIPWKPEPLLERVITDSELDECVHLGDQHLRVFKTVEVYSSRILDADVKEEKKVDIWFVIVPERVWKYCRPQSKVEAALRVTSDEGMSSKRGKKLLKQPSMFEAENLAAVPYQYEVNFHNQLKARLLDKKILTQIIRETTIAPEEFINDSGRPLRQVDTPSTVAWNLSTAVFYKAGGRPWKINNIREGVCYIGLVFKKDESNTDPRYACCAAQMFLDSGDGVVFKRVDGPWHIPGTNTFHLSTEAAKKIVGMAVDAYKEHHEAHKPPKELFLHGRVQFDDDEWNGFSQAVDASTNLVGVRIRDESHFKLFRKQTRAVLRGTAYVRNWRTAYLWTKGFIPRLQTYPGRAVPKPLLIDVCRGESEITTVLRDIMALTKLNYNTCVFADGSPVTLRFANAVGEILTAGPIKDVPPLPFRHYI